MDFPSCEHENCINWEKGRCALKDPEKEGDSCLSYEDSMDSLRLRADAIRGTLA